MDPFRLLSRSSKLSRSRQDRQDNRNTVTPSSGESAQPQLFSASGDEQSASQYASRKRKRANDNHGSRPLENTNPVDFFRRDSHAQSFAKKRILRDANQDEPAHHRKTEEKNEEASRDGVTVSFDERKRVLKQHKLKISWLNAPITSKKEPRKADYSNKSASKSKPVLFPNPLQSFEHLDLRFGIPKRLVANVLDQGFTLPTEVQLAALPLLLDEPNSYLADPSEHDKKQQAEGVDLLTVAPTGSGKTLAYMLPLLHNIHLRNRKLPRGDRHTSVIVLVPTKELAGQIVNEGRKLAKGTGASVSQMRKGMVLGSSGDDVKADMIVSTPGVLQIAIEEHASPEALSRIDHLVLDEADVLLDRLFREQTLSIWKAFTNSDLRISMWSATMGSNIEELATSTIKARRSRLAAESDMSIERALIRLVVGLKDSAVPNVQHKLIYAATEQGKLMGLRQLLHPSASSSDSGVSLRPPFLVFTQTIERAIALHAELLYDIPAEAGGVSRIAVLHSDLPDAARDTIMTRFRKGEIWILITTDLLSRGVDFRGVNGVVNYDIPTSNAAYVHRVGRTGRAGREGGVAVTLYSKEDIPYLKHVANVVAMAQKTRGGEDAMQQWLLEAIPNLSKNEKQNLKKRGIESRTSKGRQNDPKAARRARISTKAGFVRQAENKRKGAILGSQRRAEAEQDTDDGDETDFGGFD